MSGLTAGGTGRRALRCRSASASAWSFGGPMIVQIVQSPLFDGRD